MCRFLVFLLVICQFISYSNIFAQEKIYNFKSYGKSEGLVSQRIRDAKADKRGILWLATDKGLISFDGFRFHTIPFLSSQTQYINDLSGISLDPKSEKIWLTTYNEGLICYDRSLPITSSTTIYKAIVGPQRLIKNELYTVYVSSTGKVYFGGQETDLQYYDPKTDSVKYIKLSAGKNYETIFSLNEDPNGLIWVGTRYGGIYIYNPKNQQIKNINFKNLGENGGRYFTFINNEVYLNYYNYNLSVLDGINHNTIATNLLNLGKNENFYDNELTDICYLKEDNALLLSHVKNGVYVYDLKSKSIQNINWNAISPNLGVNTRINSLIPTVNGVYIASDAGLYFYSKKFNLINDFVDVGEEIKEIFQVNHQNWYLGNDHIGRLDTSYNQIINKIPLNGLKISQVNVVNNRIYLSTYDKGIYVVNKNQLSIHPLTIKGETHNFRQADCNKVLGDTIDGVEYLWIGSWSSGLYRYAIQDQKLTLFNTSNGLIDNKIITVGKDINGIVWLGMDGFGLIKVVDKRIGVFENFHHEPNYLNSLRANSIFSFVTDKKGKFWYGSSANGIGNIQYQNNKISFIQYDDPQPYKQLYPKKMAVDTHNRIWMKTSDGMMIFDSNTKRFIHLENGDGIYPLQYYQTRDFYLKDDQIIWLTKRGLIKGNIANIYDNDILNNKPIVSQFRILNEDRTYKLNSNSIVLQPSENSFAFYFASPDLIKNSNVRFSYKLSGVHSDWVTADESHQAIFTNVSEGKYDFQYRIGDLEGNWSPKISSYSITVKSYWYQSKIFRFIVAIVMIIMGFGFLFYRIEQQKTLNKLHRDFNDKLQRELIENEKKIKEQTESIEIERQQKLEADFRKQLYESELKAIRSQMNPHFIFNVLNSIEAYVVENNKLKASKLIHKFAALSRIVLENSQHPLVNIESELQLLELYLDLERERFDNMFDYKIELDSLIDPFKDRIPSMLIQPIVENAVHHGVRHLTDKHGLVYIKISKSNGYIVIEVYDNGIGFTTSDNNSYKRKSFGIQGVENRLKMMNKEGDYNNTGIFIDHAPSLSDFKTRITMKFPFA